jgi:L-fuculose-phosphate aldolase
VTPLRKDVAEVYRDLSRLGLNTGSTGNVSARTPDGMLITRTGATAETVTPDSLIAMALDGSIREPAGNAAPSSEWAMHAAIYLADPKAQAIVHTHADACTALACLNEGLPAFHYMIASFGGEDVRCAPYVTFGTPELAALATEALAGRSACLLANHGMIVHAASPRQALGAALRLETLCRQYLLARSAGTPRLLTAAEMAAAMRRFETYAAGRG